MKVKIMLFAVCLLLTSCGAILGGIKAGDECQTRSPKVGEPKREIRAGILTLDVCLPILAAVITHNPWWLTESVILTLCDFQMKTIYKPCPKGTVPK